MFAPLPEKRAHLYLKKLFDALEKNEVYLERISLPSEERKEQGVMIGCLVCANKNGEKIILYALSGNSFELRGNFDGVFVPPIVSSEKIKAALFPNDKRIHELTEKIKTANDDEKFVLKKEREKLTTESLARVHSLYEFHCIDGSVKKLTSLCKDKLPPTGTGDCTAPKLFDYAFLHSLFPVSMSEMYFGKATTTKRPRETYTPCDERCALILPAMLGLHIVYRDDDILVVNKAHGLLSVPGRGEAKQDCVVSRMKKLFPKTIEFPSVHRLDMETSGLLVLAFTKEAQRALSMQFEKGLVQKKYIALLDGVLENANGSSAPKKNEKSGEMSLAFSLDWENRPKRIYDETNGKVGITAWEKLGYAWYRDADGKNRKTTRILFTPKTGRTHQLRLAASDEHGFGLPIVGDALYGKCEATEHLHLQAFYLSFLHPTTRERMTFELEKEF